MTADDTVTANLAEWEALVDGATEGPWAVEENDYGEHAVYQDEGEGAFGTAYIAEDIRQGRDEGRADAEFIAAAPTIARALLAFVGEVRELAEWHETKAEKARAFPGPGSEAVMEKAAQVHDDAARRLRQVVEKWVGNG